MFGVQAMRGLGGLLLLAAALKMYGLAVEPVGRAGIFSEAWVQTLVVEWEIGLGVWLLWGVNRSLAWLAATVTFLAFAGFSFWQGSIGQTSCGCFGAIRVNPWIALGIDIVSLVLLAVARCSWSAVIATEKITIKLRPSAVALFFVFLFFGLFVAIGTVVFGSPAAALAFLRGERLTAEPRLLDVGNGFVGEYKSAQIHLTNWTDKAIRVFGGTSDCSCVVTDDLPITIQPGKRSPLTVRIGLRAPPGQFTRWAYLFTDDERFRVIGFRLTGKSLVSSDTERDAE